MVTELKQQHIDEYQADVFEYLNDLRDSGVTNMFGATPYIMEQFDFPEPESCAWLKHWMKSFDKSRSS
jgi:hypothetical protein